MSTQPFTGRVMPLPMRCIDQGSVNVEQEFARLRSALSPRTEVSRRSLASYPGVRIDLMALSEGASIERPWAAGRLALYCATGFVRVFADRQEYLLAGGEMVVVDARCLSEITAIDESALMATVILCNGAARVAIDERAFLPPLTVAAAAIRAATP